MNIFYRWLRSQFEVIFPKNFLMNRIFLDYRVLSWILPLDYLWSFLDISYFPIWLISLQSIDVVSNLIQKVLSLRYSSLMISRMCKGNCLFIFSRSGCYALTTFGWCHSLVRDQTSPGLNLSSLDEAMYHILWGDTLDLVSELRCLLLLLRKNLLEHLILLAKVVLVLTIVLLGSWWILHRIPLSLGHSGLLLWRRYGSLSYSSWSRILWILVAQSRRASILWHRLLSILLVFDKVNRDIRWSSSSILLFLPRLLILRHLPRSSQLRLRLLMMIPTRRSTYVSNNLMSVNSRIWPLWPTAGLWLLQGGSLCSHNLLFHQIRIRSRVMIHCLRIRILLLLWDRWGTRRG